MDNQPPLPQEMPIQQQPNEQQPAASTEQPQYEYVGEAVQIGRGFGGMVPVAQNGSITIGQGMVSIYNDAQQLIDQAPLAMTRAKSLAIVFGSVAMLYLDGRRYSISIGHGNYMAGPFSAGGAPMLFGTSKATREFLKILEQISNK